MVAAPPSVSNVQIVGDVIEGSVIKGVGEYFGGREGPSKFEWLRENNETGLVTWCAYILHVMHRLLEKRNVTNHVF